MGGRNHPGSKQAVWVATLALTLAATACATIGPATISRDQFDYGGAIADSAREQVLLNMVRLRYMEAPVFLRVASVINQYSLEGNVSLSGGFNAGVNGENVAGIGASGHWSDRPTITYTPVGGQEFASSLLTPVPPEALFALAQSGWPTSLLFGITVRSINGIGNYVALPSGRQSADPRFYELLQAWGRLRDAGAMGLRLEKEKNRHSIVMFYDTGGQTEETLRDTAFVRETLGLDPDAGEARLVYGLVPDEPNEIAVLTRSTLDIMLNLAWCFDVPPEHEEQGRTGSTFACDEHPLAPAIRVRATEEPLEDSFVDVRNRDTWFSIDDGDLGSKRTFAFLQILLSMTETSEPARGPVLAIGD